MKGIRQSKWKHVYGEQQKEKYEDVKVNLTTTESNHVKSNGKYIGVSWAGAGGALAPIPVANTGRQPTSIPLLKGHAGAILDFDWSPFHEDIVATASDDMTVKIWQVPDGGLTEDINESSGTLRGHMKKVLFATFNPAASFVLASTSFDRTLKLWDVEDQMESTSIDLPETLTSLQWNYNGTLLAGACKDKKLRIFDPRAAAATVEFHGHDSARSAKLVFTHDHLFSVGFTKLAEREMVLWDPRNTDAPLVRKVLDKSAGVIQPFYDYDSGIVFMAGKGDGNIRIYEIEGTAPYFHETHVQYGSTSSTKAIDFIPKRAVKVNKNEIMRAYKLNDKSAIEEISFMVPRRSEQFQPDLFPDCRSDEAALTGKAWLSGENADAKKRSMNPASEEQTGPKKLGILGGGASNDQEVTDLKEQVKALTAENAELKIAHETSALNAHEADNLRESVAELEASIENLNAENGSLKQKVSTLEESVESKTAELEAAHEAVATASKEDASPSISEVEGELEELRKKLQTVEEENQESQKEVETMERMVHQRDTEVEELRAQLVHVTSEVAQLKKAEEKEEEESTEEA